MSMDVDSEEAKEWSRLMAINSRLEWGLKLAIDQLEISDNSGDRRLGNNLSLLLKDINEQ